jgi:hypothetical protein
MKNLANILRRADISPKERIITIIQNEIYKEKNGKGALTDSEIYSLSQGWRPRNSHEVKEYNRYLEASKLERSMRLDAQMFGCRSENSLLRSNALINHTIYLDNTLEDFKKNTTVDKYIPREEIINFIIKNTYLNYEKLIHIITFNNLPKNVKDDLLLLDEYISYDNKYLEDEVFLYEIFKKSKPLNIQDKNTLINHIFSRMYREGVRKIIKGSEKDGFLFYHSFAELPISNIFEKWAEYAHISLEDKDIKNERYLLDKFEEYAKDRNQTMEMVIKETLSKWIDGGLFVSEYAPLFFSNRKDTWNGNTKLTHKEIFTKWYEELQKTKIFIDKLSSSGDIEIKFINREILGSLEKAQVITGESLHKCKIDIDFVKEYKDQISVLVPVVGLFLFIKKHNNPLDSYKTLKSFHKMSQTFSDLFDIDITDKYSEFLYSFEQEADILNSAFSKLLDKVTEFLCTKSNSKYILEMIEENLYFGLENEFPIPVDGIIMDYKKELKKAGFNIDT